MKFISFFVLHFLFAATQRSNYSFDGLYLPFLVDSVHRLLGIFTQRQKYQVGQDNSNDSSISARGGVRTVAPNMAILMIARLGYTPFVQRSNHAFIISNKIKQNAILNKKNLKKHQLLCKSKWTDNVVNYIIILVTNNISGDIGDISLI